MILGLTGGLGCGKSTASRHFASRGFRCLDSDAMIREYVLAQTNVVEAIRGQFGEATVAPDGSVNRGTLAGIVFNDADSRRWLEDLTHPILFARWRALLAEDAGGRWLFEVPLLFERQLENWFDLIVCVTCSPEQQLARLERRGMSRSLARLRISTQLPVGRKNELSDHVLLNDGSPAFLERQVDHLIGLLEGVSPGRSRAAG
jgi:dephospho-CoA kinase